MVKTSRRGGLGRGLGALIQNTTEPDAEESTSSATAAPDGEAALEETRTPPRRRSNTVEAQETLELAHKDSPDDDAASPATTAEDATVREKDAAAEPSTPKAPRRATNSSPSRSKSSFSASSKKTATDSKASGTETPPRQRPADIFFAPTQDEGEAASPRRSSRAGRPAMPTVKAPGRRTTSPASPAAEGAPAAPADQASTVSPDIAVLREIPVGDIHPNPRQPREVFDEEHMAELVTSITEVGILQPIVVRKVADASTPYELIMGERRWRATQKAGLETIPAIVRQTPDQDLLRDALLENLHRSQLNPLEEAAAYQQLMEDFSCTQEELSQRIGRSRPQISNTMRLLRLPPLVQRRVAAGTLSAGHARALLGLEDPAEMERLAQRIVSEGLSVRATEDAVAQLQGSVRPAPKATRGRDESTRHERLDYFATALTSRLDTQVKITLGARKGRIAIDFTSVEDLNRIMDLIQGEASAGKGRKR